MWFDRKMVKDTSILAFLGASIGNASLVPWGNCTSFRNQKCPWKSLLCIINWKWKWKSLSCVQLFGTLCLRILEWVAYPFSSRSFWPRNQTGVSCISGRFLKAPIQIMYCYADLFYNNSSWANVLKSLSCFCYCDLLTCMSSDGQFDNSLILALASGSGFFWLALTLGSRSERKSKSDFPIQWLSLYSWKSPGSCWWL